MKAVEDRLDAVLAVGFPGVVVLANASVVTEEMGAALGELTWASFCGSASS